MQKVKCDADIAKSPEIKSKLTARVILKVSPKTKEQLISKILYVLKS